MGVVAAVAGVAAADAEVGAAEFTGAVLGAVAAAGVPLIGAAALAADRPSSSPCRCPSWPRPPPAWRSAANKSCKNDNKSAPRELDAVPLELDEAELGVPELGAPVLDGPVLEVAIGVEAAVAAGVALDAFVVATGVAEFSVTN